MKTARTTAAIAALIAMFVVIATLFSLYFVYGVIIAYTATCMIAWNNSKKEYAGLLFAMQCLAYFLVMAFPAMFGALAVATIVRDRDWHEALAWEGVIAVGMFGLPALLVGLTIFVITSRAIKIRAHDPKS